MTEKITAIDFAPGLHGHFLEYIVNRFIYNVPYSINNIFQDTGAAHCINRDQIYQRSKLAERGHFSSSGYNYPDTTKQVIWIRHCRSFDFVLLVNVFERCSPVAVSSDDFNAEDIKKMHIDSMFSTQVSDLELRQNWYNKLKEYHNAKSTSKRKETDLPTYEFDYTSFFNLSDFIFELEKTASFLSMTLKFDLELVNLWQQFIQKNTGYQLYLTANRVLNNIISNTHDNIDNDWRIHAYLNSRISEIFRLHDGILFEQKEYPSNTMQVHDLIINHVKNFDTRF